MTTPSFDRGFWEQLWSRTLRERADAVADRPPNAHLTAEIGDLRPGRALDAGCGPGSDTLWLAAHGWHVTAVDFSAAALAHARSTAEATGTDFAGRVDWVEADLESWTPQPGHYDLVACLYVHAAGAVEAMIRRMGAGVAPGGTLFLVGHRPIDPATRAATPAAGQVQVSVDATVTALDPRRWEVVVAEDRPRAAAGTGVDAVIRARRLRRRAGGRGGLTRRDWPSEADRKIPRFAPKPSAPPEPAAATAHSLIGSIPRCSCRLRVSDSNRQYWRVADTKRDLMVVIRGAG